MSAPQRLSLLALLAAPLLAGCPSESTEHSETPVTPANSAPQEPTVIDEVEILGADEVAAEAEAEIDEDNVLEELEALEADIDGASCVRARAARTARDDEARPAGRASSVGAAGLSSGAGAPRADPAPPPRGRWPWRGAR